MSDVALTPAAWSAPSAEEVAAAAGAADLFVLRRLRPGRFAHIGGVGRGGGWAGIIEVDEHELELFGRSTASVARQSWPSSQHVFGPYWARWAVMVGVSADVVVIFGGADDDPRTADEDFEALARYAADGLVEVTPAKRLADELEVLTAVQEFLRQPPETTQEVLERLVEQATRALSCELGLGYVPEHGQLAICDLRGSDPLDDDSVLAAARTLVARQQFPACVQEAAVEDLPAPFTAADGVHSYYLLELKPPAQGIVLFLHTRAAPPRGFTMLCQTLGAQLVDAAQPLLAAALLRDRMRLDLARAEADARRDPLTGLANRLAWQEACESAAASSDPPSAIVIVDGGGLKRINESYGYHVGDALLQQIAEILRSCVRDADTLARLGGDEYAILLRNSDEPAAEAIVSRIREAAAASRLPDGSSVEIACGWAIDRTGNLHHAQQTADAALVNDKRRRRTTTSRREAATG